MRKIIVGVGCVGLLVGLGFAQDAGTWSHNLHLYFSYQSDNSKIPPEYTAGVNPVYSGDPIYLWAHVDPGERWNGLSLDLTVNDAVSPSPLYNPGTPPHTRWNLGSDLDFGGDNHVFGVAVTEWGLGNPFEPLTAPEYSIGTHWRVGEVDFAGTGGGEFLAVGNEGIWSPRDPHTDYVYFGFTPAGDPDGPLPGNGFGQVSQYPDIIPEPGGLLLVGLAGLSLRRR